MLSARRRAKRVVLVGLDGAGKTTIMKQLTEQATSPMRNTLPTIGFTVREVRIRGVPITLFDVGGQSMMRELWPQYCHAADALITVVDANDHLRLHEIREELHKLLDSPETGLGNAACLVLANKQDQPNAKRPDVLVDYLQLEKWNMPWHVQGSIGLDGTGLTAGMEWLTDKLSHKPLLRRKLKVSCCGCWKSAQPETGGQDKSFRRSTDEARKLDTMHTLADDVIRLREAVDKLSAETSELRADSRELVDHSLKLTSQLKEAGIVPEPFPQVVKTSLICGISSRPDPQSPIQRRNVATLPKLADSTRSGSNRSGSRSASPPKEKQFDVVLNHHTTNLRAGDAQPVFPSSTPTIDIESIEVNSSGKSSPHLSKGPASVEPLSPASSSRADAEDLNRMREELAVANQRVDDLLATNAELSQLAKVSAKIAEQYATKAREDEAQLAAERSATHQLQIKCDALGESERQISAQLREAELRLSELTKSPDRHPDVDHSASLPSDSAGEQTDGLVSRGSKLTCSPDSNPKELTPPEGQETKEEGEAPPVSELHLDATDSAAINKEARPSLPRTPSLQKDNSEDLRT